MRRILSFSNHEIVTVGIGDGHATIDGHVTLPLFQRYLIESVSCFVYVTGSLGKMRCTPPIVYFDGVSYFFYRTGFDGYFNIYAYDGAMDFYQQNEITGTGFTNFAKTKKVYCDVNTYVPVNAVFSGQNIGIETTFLYTPLYVGVLVDSEILWDVYFYYTLVINDEIPDFSKAIKTLKTIRREENFDFSPGGSSLKFQKK